jgi:hypothetical protein
MTWRTFVEAHWPLVAADFFTTEVWTTRHADAAAGDG